MEVLTDVPTIDGKYAGTERRLEQRRLSVDRREMIRYEIDRTPRRAGRDRRAPSSVWDGRELF